MEQKSPSFAVVLARATKMDGESIGQFLGQLKRLTTEDRAWFAERLSIEGYSPTVTK